VEQNLLYPFTEYWWVYLVFIGFVMSLLALDLGVFHKKAHTVGFKEASVWTLIWVTLALLFNLGVFLYTRHRFPEHPELAHQMGLEFFTGYVIEKSLSVDNVFVFLIVFRFFGVPSKYQHRVLFFGILGALVFRALFIALGAVLMKYHIVVIIFGVFLLITGLRMLFHKLTIVDPDKNWLIIYMQKHIPISNQIQGDHFFIEQSGRWFATPLFVCLVFLEFTDIIFAVDSVPAIFAITNEPLIVFTSNIFAILGLRALYFMLAGNADKFHLLNYGLAGVLVFVGLKMVWLNNVYDGKFPILWSLAIIAALIGGSVVASLLIPRPPKTSRPS
jgi:tellurite resistance protein TerC